MADTDKYTDWSVLLGSTAAPYEKGSLELGNDKSIDAIRSGGQLRDDLQQVVRKKPFLRFSLLDPSLVTAWAEFGSGKSITSVTGVWRAFAQNGGLGSTYKTAAMAQGVIMPVSLSASPTRKATLEALAVGAFSGGAAVTHGTSSGDAATVTKAFYPTSITVGGTAITCNRQLAVSWDYQMQDDEQLEPTYWYYESYGLRGSAGIRDLSKVTAARFEDGAQETVVILLTDANNGANTVSVDLGTCKVFAAIRGDEATLEFEKLGNS